MATVPRVRSGVLGERLAAFRRALAASRCDLLGYGAEPAFVQFGPIVVRDRYVLLLAVVTNHDGSVRAVDRLLEADGPPHVTVGGLADGGGRSVEQHSERVQWDIAPEPTICPIRGSPSWSRDTEESFDMSAVARRIDEEVLGAECGGPVDAEIYFELEAEDDGSTVQRFVLVGGRALELYRQVQRAFERQFWNSIRLARVSCLLFFEVYFLDL